MFYYISMIVSSKDYQDYKEIDRFYSYLMPKTLLVQNFRQAGRLAWMILSTCLLWGSVGESYFGSLGDKLFLIVLPFFFKNSRVV